MDRKTSGHPAAEIEKETFHWDLGNINIGAFILDPAQAHLNWVVSKEK